MATPTGRRVARARRHLAPLFPHAVRAVSYGASRLVLVPFMIRESLRPMARVRHRASTVLATLALAACGGGGGEGGAPVTPSPTVVTVAVTPASAQIAVGQTAALVVAARDASGNVIGGRAVSWSSASPAVATVDANGVVSGVSAGSATITATISGVAGTSAITVTSPQVAAVTLAPSILSVVEGGSATLTATARDAAGGTLADRPVTWASSAPAIASLSGSGSSATVVGVAAGSAVVSATIGGITASAPVTVTAVASSIEAIGGGDQRGLLGRPLADSLTVRVRRANGSPLAATSVTWTATGGALSSAATVTNDSGVARVQFTPTATAASVSAIVAGVIPATFTSSARASGACALAPAAAVQRFSLGPTDYTLSLRASDPLRVAVLFVDYPGLAATETPAALVSSVIEPGLAQLREMSYGRLNLTAVPFPTWYRMPKPATDYDWTTAAGHRAYLLDVLSVTDATIDFSSFDALYVFSPPTPDKPISPTFNGGTTANVVADGRNFGNAVTFGTDSRTHGPSIMSHETLHMLGLLDLYAFVPAGGTEYPGNPFKYVGAWSLMSNVFVPAHILAWEKRKLGWIDETQVDCLDEPGGVEAVLTPQEVPGGRKMIVVLADASRALAIEVRNGTGLGGNLCSRGLLLYDVVARIATGQGPARIFGSRLTTSGPLFNRCGPWADGTYGSGANPVLTFIHPSTSAVVTVVANEANGAMRVRVQR